MLDYLVETTDSIGFMVNPAFQQKLSGMSRADLEEVAVYVRAELEDGRPLDSATRAIPDQGIAYADANPSEALSWEEVGSELWDVCG